jgi:Bardet-Biedl syndrome 4 protein
MFLAFSRAPSGAIQESLQLFQQAALLNEHNPANLKQVARCLYLLGRHKQAIEVYDEAQRLSPEDWEVAHNKGLCFMYLKNYEKAVECFRLANDTQKHDVTFLQLGQVYTLQENYKAAIEVYLEALEYSPDNAEMLTTIGLLYIRLGETARAFEYLGNALSFNPRETRAILAAGSIMEDHGDYDVALVKYRVAAVQTPNSPQLWNNVGMCFLGKQNLLAAAACLQRALYLAPFEWIIAYNLGLVHLHSKQYASAFQALSAAINLKPDYAAAYAYLAVALSHMGDVESASTAYERALELERDPVFELNYAIHLVRCGRARDAETHLARFQELWNQLDEEAKQVSDWFFFSRVISLRSPALLAPLSALSACAGCRGARATRRAATGAARRGRFQVIVVPKPASPPTRAHEDGAISTAERLGSGANAGANRRACSNAR